MLCLLDKLVKLNLPAHIVNFRVHESIIQQAKTKSIEKLTSIWSGDKSLQKRFAGIPVSRFKSQEVKPLSTAEQQSFGFAEYCPPFPTAGPDFQPPTYNRNDPNDPYFGIHLNGTGIDVVGFKILVEMAVPAEIQRSIDAGLKVPDNILSRYTTHGMVAKVIQVGRGAYRSDRYPEGPWCKPGDYIAMAPYSGTRIYSKIHDKDYRLINEDTVDAVVVSPDAVEARVA